MGDVVGAIVDGVMDRAVGGLWVIGGMYSWSSCGWFVTVGVSGVVCGAWLIWRVEV